MILYCQKFVWVALWLYSRPLVQLDLPHRWLAPRFEVHPYFTYLSRHLLFSFALGRFLRRTQIFKWLYTWQSLMRRLSCSTIIQHHRCTFSILRSNFEVCLEFWYFEDFQAFECALNFRGASFSLWKVVQEAQKHPWLVLDTCREEDQTTHRYTSLYFLPQSYKIRRFHQGTQYFASRFAWNPGNYWRH